MGSWQLQEKDYIFKVRLVRQEPPAKKKKWFGEGHFGIGIIIWLWQLLSSGTAYLLVSLLLNSWRCSNKDWAAVWQGRVWGFLSWRGLFQSMILCIKIMRCFALCGFTSLDIFFVRFFSRCLNIIDYSLAYITFLNSFPTQESWHVFAACQMDLNN